MRKIHWPSAVLIAVLSMVISTVVYYVNFWAFPLLFPKSLLLPHDALFLEALLLLIIGVLIFIGYGGLSMYTYRATVLSSAASALSGKDTPSPREIMKQDAWKPKGHLRAALILVLSGIILLALYFLNI